MTDVEVEIAAEANDRDPFRPFVDTDKGEPTGEEQFISVTAALGAFPKEALVPWAAGKVADYVLRDIEHALAAGHRRLTEMLREADTTESTRQMRLEAAAEAWGAFFLQHQVQRDRKAARKQLVDSRFQPDIDEETGQQYEFTAAGLGSLFHGLADRWILTGSRPECHPELTPYMNQLDGWLDIHQPRPILAEATGINRTYGYAGRLDLVAYMYWHDVDRWLPTVLDWKTTRRSWAMENGHQVPSQPFPEAVIQTVAYGGFEGIIRWDQSARMASMGRSSSRWYYVEPAEWRIVQPMPKVERAYIVHICPEHANTHPVWLSQRLWERWLFNIEQARTIYGPMWKKMVGPPVPGPYRPDLRMPPTEGIRLVEGPPETPLEAALADSIAAANAAHEGAPVDD